MSDTPETDAATHDVSDYGPPVPCSWGDWVAADYARKLERERDEAREAADNLVEYARQSLVELEKWGKGYGRYEREMNQIRVDIARVNWREGAK
jgi:hypothetical protein